MRNYITIEEREEGKLYNQDQFGCWEFSEAEYAAYEAELLAHEAALPRKLVLKEIAKLEAQITSRRLREAVLGDNGWLAAKEAEIAALRLTLTNNGE